MKGNCGKTQGLQWQSTVSRHPATLECCSGEAVATSGHIRRGAARLVSSRWRRGGCPAGLKALASRWLHFRLNQKQRLNLRLDQKRRLNLRLDQPPLWQPQHTVRMMPGMAQESHMKASRHKHMELHDHASPPRNTIQCKLLKATSAGLVFWTDVSTAT